jgi:uncharacterized protein YkwD
LAAAAFLFAAIPGSQAFAARRAASKASRLPTACQDADLLPTATNDAAVGAATLCLIDRIRAAWHLTPVRSNGRLGSVAASQVRNMVRWNYFADLRPNGQTPLSLAGAIGYRTRSRRVSVAQNIAWGTGRSATPASIVAAWMASPPHRRVILTGSFRDAGVAAVPAVPWRLGQGSYGATYAIEFGLR